MLEQPDVSPLRRWGRAGLVAAVVALLLYVLARAWPVLAPFVLGLLIGYLILPVVDGLERLLVRLLGWPGAARLLAILLVYAAILGLVVAFFYYLAPVVAAQARQLVANREAIQGSLQEQLAGLRQWYVANVAPAVRAYIESLLIAARDRFLAGLTAGLARGLANIAGTLALIFGYLVVPFWLIYVLYDARRLGRGLVGLIPLAAQPDLRSLRRIFEDVIVAYVRGQLLVASIVGALAGLALSLLGVPFAALLGAVSAVGDLIPTLGPILAAIPTVIVAAFQRPILALWALLALIAIHQFEGIYLVPRVIGTSVRLSPAVIIILLVLAGVLWGFLGLVLVVPAVAFLRDLVRYLLYRTSPAALSPEHALLRVRRARVGRAGRAA